MVARASSPELVGREPELEALRSAVARITVHGPRVVLVEGEAGIGKSRLMAELPVLAAPARVLFGQCVELAEGALPYGPFVDILDQLAASADGGARPARLRDELSGSAPGTEPASAASRGRLFLELHDILVDCAGTDGLFLAIDDLHWSDRSTLDLIAYLARRLSGSPVGLVIAYRSDEVDRRHPLRPLVAELSRGHLLDRIVLAPLAADSIANQIGGILGADADPSFVRRVVDLADGNPFHAEELVALGGPWSSLPASLRDVLLARIERLEPEVLHVVRDAAAIGRDVDEALLAEVSGRPEDVLRELLRSAVERSVLVPTPDGRRYRFRHELLREAVYEDLLPADRVALHRRIADALASQSGPGGFAGSGASAAAELARHRDAGQQPTLAREAHLVAGELAIRARAWSEAATAFERVLVIDAASNDSSAEVDLPLMRRAARAIWFAGRPGQARQLLQSTLDRAGTDLDPFEVADAWIDLARVNNDMGDEPASSAAEARARAIVPRRPLSLVRLRTMVSASSGDMATGRFRASVRLSSCVIATADALDAPDIMVFARAQRGPSLLAMGRADEGRQDLATGRRIGEAMDDPDPLGVLLYNIGASFYFVGAFEEGLATVLDASALGATLGLERTWDPWLRFAAGHYCYWLGRWDEAARHAVACRALELNGTTLVGTALLEAYLAVHRGDREATAMALAEARSVGTTFCDLAGSIFLISARDRLIGGDPAAAASVVDEGLQRLARTDDITVRAMLADLGAEAAADAAEQSRARRDADAAAMWLERADGYARLAADLDAGRVVPGSVGSAFTRALALHAAANGSRSAGSGDRERWAEVIQAFDDLGIPHQAAQARHRAAEAALLAGDRRRAEEHLRSARATAARLAMTPLVTALDDLARRGRLDPTTATGAADINEVEEPIVERAGGGNPWGLSAREAEVLSLVGEGLTNREIARRLFISDKTASVHVTHILDKMGVSSRTEAALAAARSGAQFPGSPEAPRT